MMFVLIPDIVDQDHELHAKAQRLCGYVISLSSSKIGCLAGDKYFAKKLNVSVRTVQRYLESLKEKGYILVEDIKRESKTPIRMIVPSSKILVDLDTSRKNVKAKEQKHNKKNSIPFDIESDWLDNYLENR